MSQKFKLVLALIAILNLNFAFSQEEEIQEEVSIITDRPDLTESSSVVPKNSLQIETGFLFEKIKDSDLKNTTFNTTLLRYGLLERLELRLGIEYLGLKSNTYKEQGMSPLYAGFKVFVCEEKGLRPEIAFLSGLVLPFSAKEEFKSTNIGSVSSFSLAHTLSEKSSIGYNLGIERDGEIPTLNYFYTIAYGYAITDKFGFYAEFYGDFQERHQVEKDANHLFDAGFTFLANNKLQFDISAGSSLQAEQEYFISTGFSLLIL